jgi:aminoglycoside/choline kinase family phosphotransferase
VEQVAGFTIDKMDELAGDASSRKYYRISFDSKKTAIVMLSDSHSIDLFVEATALMKNASLRIPQILGRGVNFLLIEDLGDLTLQSALLKMTDKKIGEIYAQIMDDLFEFQKFCTKTSDRNFVGFSLAFDIEKLKFESDFAFEHFVKTRFEADITAEQIENAKKAFEQIN